MAAPSASDTGRASEAPRRRVGRPSAQESGGPSLALLLNLIRTGTATTRLELEQQAELGRAVVADRLATLQALQLVQDGEIGEPRGGRAPRHVRFREDAGSLLVAAVDAASLAVALTDLAGHIVIEHHEPVDLARGPQAILERITTLFVWLLDERGGRQQAWTLSLSLPEPATADVAARDALGPGGVGMLEAWRRFDFSTELALRFGAPCRAHSAVQAMTFGELKAGAGQGASDLLFVRMDRSVTAGIVCAGRIQGGANGVAGMIGHAATAETGSLACSCGNTGCLEVLAGGDAIAREGDTAARTGRSRYLADMLARNGEVGAIDVGHGAQLGDAFCAELLSRCGRLVGETVAPLANLLNPAVIILGGSVAQSGEILLAAVREAVYRQAHPLVTRSLRIVRSQMGATAALVGSAHIAIEELFGQAAARLWVPHGSPRREPSFLARLDADRARSRQAARKVRPPQEP